MVESWNETSRGKMKDKSVKVKLCKLWSDLGMDVVCFPTPDVFKS